MMSSRSSCIPVKKLMSSSACSVGLCAGQVGYVSVSVGYVVVHVSSVVVFVSLLKWRFIRACEVFLWGVWFFAHW